MFIGMIGFSYTVGLASIWMMVGNVLGDLIASLFIHKRLRIATEKSDTLSFAGALSSWNGTNFKVLRFIGGLITVIFLGTYAAAQLNAASKGLHVLFGWDYAVGAIIGAAMVLIYCLAGGIRASIWTDVAQSCVMFIAMVIMVYVSVDAVGGVAATWDAMGNVSDTYTNFFIADSPFGEYAGPIFFILGWTFSGFGIVGQPHVMVRFMAMNQPKDMARVRLYYYTWYAAFYALTIAAGFGARLLIPNTGSFDAELALPMLAQQMLPDILVGVILAGLFSSAMSTADSQILSCSAALMRDLTFGKKLPYYMTKLATVTVTLIALFFALSLNQSVFAMALLSWSALATAFAPLLTIYALGAQPSEKTAISMMLFGLLVLFMWRHYELGKYVYEVLPGILAGFVPFLLTCMMPKSRRLATH